MHNANNIKTERNISPAQLDQVLEKYKDSRHDLISILQETQKIYGYIPIEAIKYIADRTGQKKSKIYGVATFYSQFRLKPVGKYVIQLCQGTACHVNGSKEIERAICKEFNIHPKDTSQDGLLTLENVACLGCCSLAPVMMINGQIYGKLTPTKAIKIINDLKEGGIDEN